MHYYIPFVLTVAALTVLLTRNIGNAIAVLVVSCPCGHMLVSSAPMIAALAAATKRGVLIKNSKFVEQLTQIKGVIFDKTGTITRGELSVSDCYLQAASDEDELLTAAAAVASGSMHPISRALMGEMGERSVEQGWEIRELPGKGVSGRLDGREILFGTRYWMEALGYHLDETELEHCGGSANWVVADGRVLGCLLFNDSVRPEAANVVQELRTLGVDRTVLLTGDRNEAAQVIQRQVGIDEAYAQLLPQEKLERVKALRMEEQVLAVGDGINDALALAEADVGIAMGAMGSDIAIQSADIALMNNDLENIPYVIALARMTRTIMYQNIAIAFSVSLFMMLLSAVGLIPALAGAFLHNIGAFIILINSSRILRQGVKLPEIQEEIPEEAEDERSDSANPIDAADSTEN